MNKLHDSPTCRRGGGTSLAVACVHTATAFAVGGETCACIVVNAIRGKGGHDENSNGSEAHDPAGDGFRVWPRADGTRRVQALSEERDADAVEDDEGDERGEDEKGGLEDLQVAVAKEEDAGAEHHEQAEEDTTRDRRRPGEPPANPNVDYASHNAGYAAEDEEGECPTRRDLADGAEVCLGAVVRFVDEEDDAHHDAAEDTAEKGAEEGAGEDAGRERPEAARLFPGNRGRGAERAWWTLRSL